MGTASSRTRLRSGRVARKGEEIQERGALAKLREGSLLRWRAFIVSALSDPEEVSFPQSPLNRPGCDGVHGLYRVDALSFIKEQFNGHKQMPADRG